MADQRLWWQVLGLCTLAFMLGVLVGAGCIWYVLGQTLRDQHNFVAEALEFSRDVQELERKRSLGLISPIYAKAIRLERAAQALDTSRARKLEPH